MRQQRRRIGRAIAVLGFAALGFAALWPLIAGSPGQAAPSDPARPLLLAQARPAGPGPNVEADIAQLHQRLQITPAQEPQFAAFAAVMRENARAMPAGPPPGNPNAVEALRLAIQYGQQDLDGMRRLLPALQTLYASLSPAQRRTADQVFRQGPGE